MSFKHEHYTIEHVLEYTEKAKQEQAKKIDEHMKADGSAVEVDGLWLCKEAANIVNELRKKHRT